MKASKNLRRRPARLKPGDKIGIAAPAGAFDKKKFNRGLKVLKAMGFEIHVPEDLFVKDGYLAGTDLHRAEVLNRLFRDKTIRAVICARGGYGAMRLLPLLDYRSIRKNPKIFIGFSDITALLTVLYSRCRLVAFHGPVVTSLGVATRKSQKAFLSAVSTTAKVCLIPQKGITIRPGLAVGPVVGGNLTTLCHLVGTPYTPRLKGCILVLEEIEEPAYRIDRMLTQMKLGGCFEGLAGLALGSFRACGQKKKIYQLMLDRFGDLNIPILAGFEIGHGRSNTTFPVGLEGTLDTRRRVLSFQAAGTAADPL